MTIPKNGEKTLYKTEKFQKEIFENASNFAIDSNAENQCTWHAQRIIWIAYVYKVEFELVINVEYIPALNKMCVVTIIIESVQWNVL